MEIDRSLKRIGFIPSLSDESLYIKNDCYLLIYVDDLLLVGEKDPVNKVNKELTRLYEMIDLGPVKRFLGIMVEWDRKAKTIKLHQAPYIKGLLRRYELENCNLVHMPMMSGLLLYQDDGSVKFQG